MATMQEAIGAGVSRRSFMQGALATGVAGVIGAMGVRSRAYADDETSDADATGSDSVTEVTGAPSTNGTMDTPPDTVSEDDIVETIDCDIVVVGAGVAGMAAIMYASAQGADVHVLEKSSEQGVHRLCVAGANAELVESLTDEKIDPKEFTWDAYRCMGGFQTKMPILSRYVKDSGKWIDWLQSAITPYGWTLLPFPATTGYPNNRSFTDSDVWPEYDLTFMFQNPDGESLGTGASPNWMELFREIGEDNGATFHFNEPGWYLEREDGGRVTGVISRNCLTGEYRRYNASLGVLLAAGDFYNDKQMVHTYAPHLEKCVSSIAEPNNSGDMHKAGIWVGATMDDYSAGDLFGFQNVQNKNWISPREGDEDYNVLLEVVRGTMWAPAVSGIALCMWVDDGGRRFCNEDMNAFQQSSACNVLATPTGKAWSIWDSAWESKLPDDWENEIPGLLSMMSVNTQTEIEREFEEGLIQRYDTLEELAEGCGFDYDYFQETVDRYNSQITDANPHTSHASNAFECSNCHSLTGTSVNMCNQCHDFDTPDGWVDKDYGSTQYGLVTESPLY